MSARRRDWVRTFALGGVIVATAVLSYATLRDRALHIGFPEWAVWFYPLGIDATILGASRAWHDSKLSQQTRRLAMWITLGAIAAAVGAFVAEFADEGWVGISFAVLVPASLAATLVLTSWSATDRRNGTDPPEEDQAEMDAAASVPEVRAQTADPADLTEGSGDTARQSPEPSFAAAAEVEPTAEQPSDGDLDDRIRPLVAAGLGRTRVMRELEMQGMPVSTHRAMRSIKRVRQSEPQLALVQGGDR